VQSRACPPGHLADEHFGGDEKRCDRRRILKRRARDLGRIDYAGPDKVANHRTGQSPRQPFVIEEMVVSRVVV